MRRLAKIKSKNLSSRTNLDRVIFIGLCTLLIAILNFVFLLCKDWPNIEPILIDQLITNPSLYSESDISEWHSIDLRTFSIQTPVGYRFYVTQGFDSYVGGITDQRDTLFFDYGLYSQYPEVDDMPGIFSAKTENINGQSVNIIITKPPSGFIGAYAQQVKGDMDFSITCNRCDSLEEKLKIIRTIDFN